jgi:colanic acid biosynthesis glycosyl transferase WcaI
MRVTRCPLVARSGSGLWRLIAPLTFALSAMPVVVWRCLAFRPDTVLCVEPTLFAAPAAWLAAQMVGARTVLHVQDLEIDAAFATGHLAGSALQTAARAVERFLLRRFDAVVTISDAMAERLRQRGVPNERVTVLRNWITPPSEDDAGSTGPVLSRLPIPPGRRVVLYAGNLGLKQGLPVLIEAARRLRCRADLHLLIIGDGPMAPALRAAAASLPNLTVTGLLPSEDLPALLAAVDCHVLPQDRAASELVFPSKLGPILASGRPCVITSEPWRELAQWVGDAATLAPPGDGWTLAELLISEVAATASRDPARAQALAAALDGAAVLPLFERVLLPVHGVQPAVEPVWTPAEPGYAPAH